MRTMNKKKLIVTAFRILAFIIVLVWGLPFVLQGFQMLQEKPTPEKPLTLEVAMKPKVGGEVGTMKIKLNPTEAFIIGDKITTDIEVDVNWLKENESALVYVTFVDSLSTDVRWAWTNTTEYNCMIFPEYNYSMSTYAVYKATAFVSYAHEGVFGVNVSVYSPYSQQLWSMPNTSRDGTVDWSFPEAVHIKSYEYIEQKANAGFTNALSVEVLGLTILGAGLPIAMTSISLGEKLYDSIVEKPKKPSSQI
jgi:hypothetical protein